MTDTLCFVCVLWRLPFPTSMQMLPWGCHIWHLPESTTNCFCKMGTHQLAGSSPAKGVSFAGCLVLGVAGPWRCLWGGGLFWLHVLGFVFYYCFSGAADFIISSVLRTCVGIHLMLWCGLCFFISLLVICTHQFDRLGFIFGLFPFSFTWQGYIYHDTD